MKGFETITWEEAYKIWETYILGYGLAILRDPLPLEEIHVEYKHSGKYIYGYDWLMRDEYEQRKESIEKNPIDFLLLTKSTNKGTIRTIQMLHESQNKEEQAAIWMYAFSHELLNVCDRGDLCELAYGLQDVTWQFLSEHFVMWHHAMKRLIPEIYFSNHILKEMKISSFEALIQLICVNSALISYEYVPILYSSLEFGKRLDEHTIRKIK